MHPFSKILSAVLYQKLRPLGFRLKHLTFISDESDVFSLINLQSSSKTTKDVLVVTLNLGVYSKTIAEMLGEPKKEPDIWDCHWRRRIGHLLPKSTDMWWEIHNQSEAESTASEFASLLELYGIQALEEVSSTNMLLESWRHHISPGLMDVQRDRYLALFEE